LAVIIRTVGDMVGPATNPAREVGGRLVVALYTQDWKVFTESDGWVWIPVTWTFSGCLMGPLLFWLLIEIPRQMESNHSPSISTSVMDKKPPVLPPTPPPPPPVPHWPSQVFLARNTKDEKRASQISKHLDRYQEVDIEKKDEGHKVVLNVGRNS